jgi:hypothetical protein
MKKRCRSFARQKRAELWLSGVLVGNRSIKLDHQLIKEQNTQHRLELCLRCLWSRNVLHCEQNMQICISIFNTLTTREKSFFLHGREPLNFNNCAHGTRVNETCNTKRVIYKFCDWNVALRPVL